jgi:uncharacterized membrane protein (DUF485 family)
MIASGQPFWGTTIFIIYLLFMLGIVVCFVLTIISIWRLSIAHKSLAESVKEIAISLKKEP